MSQMEHLDIKASPQTFSWITAETLPAGKSPACEATMPGSTPSCASGRN